MNNFFFLSETAEEPTESSYPDNWTSMLPPVKCTNFAWVGHVSQQLSLSPQSSHQSMLWACFSKPGVFNLNSIRIMARSPTDTVQQQQRQVEAETAEGQGKVQRSGFTRQRNLSPNLVTVVESES